MEGVGGRKAVDFSASGGKPDYPRFAPEERRGGAKRKSKTKRWVVGVESDAR